MSAALDLFSLDWSHTAKSYLRDRTDEGGNQSFGFFKSDYSPRKAAVFLHNLTTILADRGSLSRPSQLNYSLAEQPPTVHDMLLQKSDGSFALLVWDERLSGTDLVTVHLGAAYPNVKIFDPTIGTEPVQTATSADSLKLTLSNPPLILAVFPK